MCNHLILKKNFYGNLIALNRNIELIDKLILMDTSGPIPVFIGEWQDGRMYFNINMQDVPSWVSHYLTKLFSTQISES